MSMNESSGALYLGVVDTVELDANGCLGVYLPALRGIFNCRVAMPMAGAGRGLVFLPEKGDQVLVAPVLGSDVGFALLGGMWSLNAKPPELDGAPSNDTKLIHTRGGNLIRLIDTEGAESIEISTSKKQHIKFWAKDDSVLIATGKGSVVVRGDKMEIIASGGIALQGDVTVDGKLTVGKGASTTIDGNTITGK